MINSAALLLAAPGSALWSPSSSLLRGSSDKSARLHFAGVLVRWIRFRVSAHQLQPVCIVKGMLFRLLFLKLWRSILKTFNGNHFQVVLAWLDQSAPFEEKEAVAQSENKGKGGIFNIFSLKNKLMNCKAFCTHDWLCHLALHRKCMISHLFPPLQHNHHATLLGFDVAPDLVSMRPNRYRRKLNGLFWKWQIDDLSNYLQSFYYF